MENFPRTEMLAPELKDPEHPFPMTQCNKIKSYIAMHYQNDPNHFNAAFSELDDMRNKMLQPIDEHELICVLKRYYAQLTMMKNRFPMELDGDASIQFTWTERSSDNPLPIVIPDINFEICCVMYNIGCLHAIVAASQERKDEDSSKTAFMHFQHAAWPFICLRDELNAGRCGLASFDDIALTFYANVMLAQAQECILEKSISEKRSSAIICKIAYRIFQLYNSCGGLIANPSFADMMPSSRYKNWTRLCSIKGAIYGVIYFHARGQEFSQDQKHGAALACFKAGLDLANEAMPLTNRDKRGSFKETLIFVKDVIAQREQISRKENDLIYHERIPTISELEEVKGVDMVKAISFKATDPSIVGEDLFRELLPTSVVEIVSLYEEAKAELRRSVLKKCEKMDTELEAFLLTLKLDKLNLDQPGDIQRLPDELISCYSEFNSEPGCLNNLLGEFDELSKKTTDVECKLANLEDRISSMHNSQLATSDGYKAISKSLNKLTEQHKQARANNTELHKRLETHKDNLNLFALSLPELTNKISGKVIDTSKSPEGQELRRLLDKVDEMRKQRIRLIADLREALDKDDITSHALVDPYSDPTPIIRTQLTRHDKLIGVIDQNLVAQTNILKALTGANANFADFRGQIIDTIESKKSKALTLVTAFETFKQIRANIDTAFRFYDRMLDTLKQIQGGVEGMENAKKQEDEEQRIIMEKERSKLQSMEVAEFVKEFSLPPNQQTPQSYLPTTNYSPVNQPQVAAPTNPGRPTLKDFMRNRNKAPVSSASNSSPVQMAQVPQPQVPQAQIPQAQVNQQQTGYPAQVSQHQTGYPSQVNQHQMPQTIMPTSQYAPQQSHTPQMQYQYSPVSQQPTSIPQIASTSHPIHSLYQPTPVVATQPFVHSYSTPQPMQQFYSQPMMSVQQPQQQAYNIPQPTPQQQVYNIPQSTPQPQQQVYNIPQSIPSSNYQNGGYNQQPTSQQQAYNIPQSVPQPQQQVYNIPQPIPQSTNYQNNGFNSIATNGNANGSNQPATIDPNQSAQSVLDDLFFGGNQPAKPQTNNPQQQPTSQPQMPPTSNYMQPSKPTNGTSSPWHSSSINPLLMNRKL